MSRLRVVAAVLGALLVASPAQGDVVLEGWQHIGNNDGRCEFTPDDPVTHAQYRDYPSTFHLTQMTTVTAVRLNSATGVDNPLTVRIDGVDQVSSCAACSSCNLPATINCGGDNSCGSVVIDLTPDVTLSPGFHTISVRDTGSPGNDYAFSSITLLSAETSTSRMLNQRRHPGKKVDPNNDNDANDDYDITDTGSPYYPDLAEGYPLDIGFNIDQNRRLSEIRFYRLRDVDNPSPQNKVLVDGFFTGALLDTGDPLEVNPTIIATNQLLLAGNHTLRVDLGVLGTDNLDSFSWDDIILRFVDAAPVGSLGRFNATDPGEAPLNGVIKTKIANKTFDLDLHAIDPLGTGVNTAYTGTVNVELLDASSDAGGFDIYGCRSSWTLVHTLGSVTFTGGDNGKKRISSVSYPNARRVARARVTDTATGARGCSTDTFAIRPKDFQADASDDTWTTAGITRALPTGGYSSTSTPIHKAGRPFTLRVTPRGEGGGAVTGYDGQPEVSAILSELGATFGTVAAPGGGWYWSAGVLRNDQVTYSEVGAVRLRVQDTTYADIDLADSTATERTINKDDVKVGRFVPDRFDVQVENAQTGCVGADFTYIGQPVSYAAGGVTLKAVNADGVVTTNYTGLLYKLPATVAQAAFTVYDDPGIPGTPAMDVGGGDHDVVNNNDGTASVMMPAFSVQRPATPLAQFPAEIGVQFPVFSDGDGVLPQTSPIVMGTAAPGSGIPFTGQKTMRYGRLYIQPSFGSELESLRVPMRTETWDGTTFVNSGAATCTPLGTADITANNLAVAQTVGLSAAPVPDAGWTIDLSAPGDVRQVGLSVDVGTVGPYLFLRDDADADGNFDNDPQAPANFGFYNRSGDNRIYQREIFR